MTCNFCHGVNQGHSCPACLNATRAAVFLPPLPARNFDTLRDRMQQPESRGYSVWAAIAGANFFAAVVTVACLLKGIK